MELNAEQIKKALECCRHNSFSKCTECPCGKVYQFCSQELCAEALALIKELTEENERLRAEQSKIKRKVLMEAASKFAGHSDYHGDAILCKLICMSEGKEVGVATPIDEVRRKETRADTVRKMRQMLKEHLEKPEFPWDSFTVAEEVIDQIAKEMLEEGRGYEGHV